jgi:50S ribosomal protein L16 3-hydroxylase
MIEELIRPLGTKEFSQQYLGQQPYAMPGTAEPFKRLLSWAMLASIFNTGHQDCWLVKNGKLAAQHDHPAFRVTLTEAMRGFTEGYTVLVRHSERVHRDLNSIASKFLEHFQRPIDIQLYVTPYGQEGFDWHFDAEDVFVIQSSGEKEFYLRKSMSDGPEIRCHLCAGDFLYIPRGYWHKARAITDSCHISVGLLMK